MKFADKFFDGVPFDFSKALMVFSFNDESKLNPVLRDRLTIIQTKGFSHAEQFKISQDFLLPDLCQNVGISKTASCSSRGPSATSPASTSVRASLGPGPEGCV